MNKNSFIISVTCLSEQFSVKIDAPTREEALKRYHEAASEFKPVIRTEIQEIQETEPLKIE